MKKIKIYICFALCVAGILPASGVQAAAGSGDFRSGRLPNSLTYYVRHTAAQPGRAGFYLVQNVGSLMEEDNQQGLAHFLEHMAFNGSQNFPGQIDRFLQRRNLNRYNAYTDYDQTVYNIDNVPTADRTLVDSSLLVLHDWCHFLTFPEQGIAKERGIILEERRTRRDAVARAREQIVQVLYNGSRYSSREVIGKQEVLESFVRADLESYYKRWYRPDLQAVIVVGDIDPQYVEDYIKEHFSQIPMPENAAPRPIYTIDDCEKPQYVHVVDEELGQPMMEFTQRFAKQPAAKDARELIKRITLRQLYNSMMSARMSRSIGADKSAVRQASISYDQLLRGYDASSITITPYPQRDFRALYEVFGVLETVRKFGFTPYEFEQNKRVILREAEGFENNLDKIGYGVYVTLYENHYLNSTPVVEPTQRAKLMREVVGELTVEDLNAWVKERISGDANRVFVVSGSDPAYEYLTLEDILSAEQDVRESDLQQPSFAADTTHLIDFPLRAGTIVREQKLPVGDATMWTLSNGAKVCFKAAEPGSGKFRISAVSKGGLSLIEPKDIPSAQSISSLAFSSGVYNTSRSAMIDMMQGREMEITFSLQNLGEMIVANASSSEAERLFEMFHLGLTKPRFDEPEFARYINELKLSIETRRPTPFDMVADSVSALFTKPSPRRPKVDQAYIDQISLERVRTLFSERFCNPADFTYYIVGDLDLGQVRELACRYIGSIESPSRKTEKYILHPTTNTSVPFTKEYIIDMPDDKAIIDISYSANIKMSREQSTAFWLMGVILNSRSTDEIRERRGGSYNVEVSTRNNELADPRQWLTVHFETSGDKVDEMKQAVYKEIDDIVRDGVTQADVNSIVSAQKERLASTRRDIGYWLNAINTYLEDGVDPTRADYHTSVLDAMTPEAVKRIAVEFNKKARKAEIVVRAKPAQKESKNENEKQK